jgi:hypothetical protein
MNIGRVNQAPNDLVQRMGVVLDEILGVMLAIGILHGMG